MMKINIEKIRSDFPSLSKKVNNSDLVYLDNAATTQKPIRVIDSINRFYNESNGNPHRGSHQLSVEATDIYETSREKVREFINARSPKEIIFTKGATESLNMLAYSYGMSFIEEGDEIVISILEHHSNLIPWQQVAKAKKAKLKYLYVDSDGCIAKDEIEKKITNKTKLVSITHISNALGTINPIEEITSKAHEKGAKVIMDASQSIPHMNIDVQKLDVDFLVFSGHKMLAPMGIGILYGKEELLEKMPPFLYGGDMIEYVYEDHATFAELPYKLEAGTQNVEGALGLMEAISYLNEIGMENIEETEKRLTSYMIDKLNSLPYVKIYGPSDLYKRGAVISFNIDGVHPHDAATILDAQGIAIRAGHHCCQPLMKYLGINSTCRASLYFYNTENEVDKLVEGIKKVREVLGYEP